MHGHVPRAWPRAGQAERPATREETSAIGRGHPGRGQRECPKTLSKRERYRGECLSGYRAFNCVYCGLSSTSQNALWPDRLFARSQARSLTSSKVVGDISVVTQIQENRYMCLFLDVGADATVGLRRLRCLYPPSARGEAAGRASAPWAGGPSQACGQASGVGGRGEWKLSKRERYRGMLIRL